MPSSRDKCPVCGMFVAKYPDFVAEIVFKDGSRAFFDGAKDMLKYYFDLAKYNPSKKASDIESIYVTDYYSMRATDGRKALFVVGSNVYGPMGREFIPFANEEDANEFMRDHAGKTLVRFTDITPEMVKNQD
ncbi:NosL protein [Syntrophobacter fumaroxidans MPOB]|uniref:NosL protein n=2 Tax=Syntrophobacter TaxID=29526 RepID=A0LM42_SYNFM|nr:NosL protein [Syntrophobacter fumaroxidans MPOB]